MINILLSLRIFNQKYIYDVLKNYVNKNQKITILAYSFFDQFTTKEAYENYYNEEGPYYQKLLESFSIFGVTQNQILWIDYYKDSKETAIKKLNEADIIYLPGGAPDQMMKRIVEKGLLDTINSLDKTFIGVSAGTMIQFNNYYISKDQEYNKYSEQRGINFIDDFYVEVHYRRRKQQKKSIKKVWKLYHKDMYVIPDDGMIVVENNEIKLYGNAKQKYNKKGIIK